MSTLPVLYIGNRNYSSWSLRAWLALRFMGYAFRTVLLQLDTPAFATEVRAISGAGRVPVLCDAKLEVWDSLAICEYVAERSPQGGWPREPDRRAHARSSVAEMHAGFAALRRALPMNARARRRLDIAPDVAADSQRILGLWGAARALGGDHGPWLYGERGIADAFFAPVLLRFETYGIALPEVCQPWRQALLADPHLQAWCAEAAREPWVLDGEEVGEAL